MKKLMPIGISEFGKLINVKNQSGKSYNFVDKSMLINDIYSDAAEVMLITRPRRFGKTLNLSMIQHFFAKEVGSTKTADLFEGLEVSKHADIMALQGKFPVIFVTLKDLKQDSWEKMLDGLKKIIRDLFEEHKYLQNSPNFDENDKNLFAKYLASWETLSEANITESLKLLSKYLFRHYGENVIILLDEYDTPIMTGYLNDFYKEVAGLFRGLFGEAFKGNVYLRKAVITGITRIAKESLFSDLNNLKVYTVNDTKFSQYFGFTQPEVEELCQPQFHDQVKEWYDGYLFGNTTIYNPWSVLNCIDSEMLFEPYWINTSSNDLIHSVFHKDYLPDVTKLLEGQAIDFDHNQSLVLKDFENEAPDAFFNLLLTAGYLSPAPGGFKIPNKEVGTFFNDVVRRWMSKKGQLGVFNCWIADMLAGKAEAVQDALQVILMETLSIHDVTRKTVESFYHGLMVGLLVGMRENFIIKSNRESGLGRYDIAIIPKDATKNPGIIIEVKNGESAEIAFDQIKAKAYTTELVQHGCSEIRAYGMSFQGKEVFVVGGDRVL